MRFYLDAAQAEAVANLLNSHDFRVFMGAVSNHGEQVLQAYIYASDDFRATLQGKCQAVTELIDAVNAAPETVQNYKKSK